MYTHTGSLSEYTIFPNSILKNNNLDKTFFKNFYLLNYLKPRITNVWNEYTRTLVNISICTRNINFTNPF